MWPDLPPPEPAAVQAAPAAAAPAEVHFGGPDQPPRALRDLLQARIEAAPPGSEILWVTYYFRDMGLADALVAAQARGVKVRVVLDARPRLARANAAVIARLAEGLGEGLRLHRPLLRGPRLHAKIYAFSGPTPAVFVGSFNPSGDEPEDPQVLAEIGDQDRGHNLLVQYRDPGLVAAIRGQAERIWRGRGVSRLSVRQNRPVRLKSATLYFFPRLRTGVVERGLAGAGPGDRVRAAVSHLEPGPFASGLAAAARRGADVELVTHDTERRAPGKAVKALARAGVKVRRYCHPDGLPMHAKFVIVHSGERADAWFGSLNYNLNSRFLNHEILVRSADPALVSTLEARFAQISDEARRLAQGAPGVWRVSAAGGGPPSIPVRALARDRACDAAALTIAEGAAP